ncbi:Rv1733c family protein [Mycolicibacterium arenosum]|uniref:Transmembrane protein n=1 Tax=Mycolicibacterium arenosum TaxID=2952157 RepID=A0ABT1LVS0_9MYCO|nr:hypothetical protein [Mycolicibacterium sp. CAU 1645]MCP9271000.1 hypothetical protein [Mycolicibacterium sp. CAU 1645]
MDTFTVLPRIGWVACLTGRNTLVRRSDRVEALIGAMAAILVLCAAPVSAALGTAVHETRSEFYADQLRHRHIAEAIAVSDSETTVRTNAIEFDVDARWRFDDTYHVERVRSQAFVKVHDRFQIWVDDEGAAVPAPPPPGQAGREAVGAAVLSWLGVVFVMAGVCGAVRHRLNRVRHANWDREFEALVDGRGQERRQS